MPKQAEQCDMLGRYKGKYTVKTGGYDELIACCSMLLETGLSAELI